MPWKRGPFTRSDALPEDCARAKVLLSSPSRKSNESHFLPVIVLKQHDSSLSTRCSPYCGVPCLPARAAFKPGQERFNSGFPPAQQTDV